MPASEELAGADSFCPPSLQHDKPSQMESRRHLGSMASQLAAACSPFFRKPPRTQRLRGQVRSTILLSYAAPAADRSSEGAAVRRRIIATSRRLAPYEWPAPAGTRECNAGASRNLLRQVRQNRGDSRIRSRKRVHGAGASASASTAPTPHPPQCGRRGQGGHSRPACARR